MEFDQLKIVVFVPESHEKAVREALAAAGAGRLGNYDSCSFSSRGTGRFRPQDGANPAIGEVGKLEEVAEVRIEALCMTRDLDATLEAVKAAHPYEEPAIDVYPLYSSP